MSATIGSDRLVEMDWMLPGIAPTGKRVECATVAIVAIPRR
jgi:hypothetical protein